MMRSLSVLLVLVFPTSAHADTRWRLGADIDADSLVQEGVAVAIGVTPATLPSWRFSLAMRSHDVPDTQVALAGANNNMYVTMPISLEAIGRYRHPTGAVGGVRAGMIHLHFTRLGTFGIDEEFDYGITPFVGYEWSPHDRIYVQPWLGAMLTLIRQTHGELPMEEPERTYARWPALLRGGLTVGARY